MTKLYPIYDQAAGGTLQAVPGVLAYVSAAGERFERILRRFSGS